MIKKDGTTHGQITDTHPQQRIGVYVETPYRQLVLKPVEFHIDPLQMIRKCLSGKRWVRRM